MKKISLTLILVFAFVLVVTDLTFAGNKVIATPPCSEYCMNCAPNASGAYSQAIKTGGIVYLAGQIAKDPCNNDKIPGTVFSYNDDNEIVGVESYDIVKQTERVMQNLGAVLAAARLDFGDVLSTTVYLKNIDDFAAFNAVYGLYFKCGEYSVTLEDSNGAEIVNFTCADSDPYCGNNCNKKGDALSPPSRATVGGTDIPGYAIGARLEVSMIAGK